MTEEDLRTAVKEAVCEALPIALVDELEPMVRRGTVAVFRRYRRLAVVGFLLLAIAMWLLYQSVQDQANTNSAQARVNTSINHKQDCVLFGLIVGIQKGDSDPNRNKLYNNAIRQLTASGRCPIKQ